VAALLALTPRAYADDEATARQLFKEGRALLAAGRLDEACAKFAASVQAYTSVGPLLNLGQCHEKQGKTATAFAAYHRAVALAEQAGQAKRVQAAKEFAAALEPKLSKLTIRAPSPVPGLQVLRDGVAVVPAALGTAVPLDPGRHTIEATAAGYQAWATAVELGREADQQTVVVPALVPKAAPVALPSAATAPSPEHPAPSPDGADSDVTLRIAGIVIAGTGAALLVAGTVLGALAIDAADEAESDPALCPDKQCTPEGREVISDGEVKGTVSTAAFVIGGGGVALGAALIAITLVRDQAEPAPAARLVPAIGPTGGGLLLVGAF